MAGDLETTWWQWLREEADHWWMPLGGAALLLAAGHIYFEYEKWTHARAARRAAEEAAALAANPRAFTPAELLIYNGSDVGRPLLLALKGVVLDVRTGADYYGPGGPYQVMAGRDASKAFAMMSLKEEDAHADLTGVDDEHLKILDDWYDKLSQKYPTVGSVSTVGSVAVANAPAGT